MTDLIQTLDEMVATTDVEDLWTLHKAKMRTYGFDRLIYGFTRHGGSASVGSPSDWMILSSQTHEYMNSFVKGGLNKDAPMLRWALEHEGACSWQWMHQKAHDDRLTASERRVLEFNKSMGVTAGYTISFRSVSLRVKGAIALTAASGMTQDEVDQIWAIRGREILLLNNVMHLKVQTLPQAVGCKLTNRQREVLQWVGDGKSVMDIAVLLGRKPATVEKHLRLAREALGVETTAQAVLKAALHNQMFVVAPEKR
ncbi:autoinducer binding domain-containing protein [Yoonia sp.]|uniref:autoinducer binding domain-containing protein n=1 Tax=Yoonia sp. TaxID=2212373 RepID=UPI002FD9D0F7